MANEEGSEEIKNVQPSHGTLNTVLNVRSKQHVIKATERAEEPQGIDFNYLDLSCCSTPKKRLL
jgi:hypothetical protein